MNYKIMAGFLAGVVIATSLVNWDRDFRKIAHSGLVAVAIIAAWIF